ncbi:MAG: polysaccharide deacetylase family protein [Planctomycetota bacterium]|nr:polysaccharide deacetylase family protein [Planctomycetota bacterium]
MQDRTLKLLSPLLYESGAWPRRWRADVAARGPWGVVVTYHRVRGQGEPIGEAWMEAERGIDAATLRAHMEFLARHFAPVPLTQMADPTGLAKGLAKGKGLSFAVTFDDGYEDNLTVAAPLLRAMGIPATFFVVSEYVGTDKRFWWETLAQMLRRTRAAKIAPAEIVPHFAGLAGPLPLDSPDARQEAHRTMTRAMTRWPHDQVWPALGQLAAALGVESRSEGRDYRLMDWTQVLELQAQGFEIGGHTATHANLGAGDPATIEREIAHCLGTLAEKLGRPVRTFAYPYGARENRGEVAMRALERGGCLAAVTTDLGVVRADAPRWLWPRIDLNKRWGFACAYNVERARQANASAFISG